MTTIQTLVACSDLTGYAKLTGKLSEEEIFYFLSDYYEFVGDTIAPSGGRVIKFMGDAALMTFSEVHADSGVRSLLALQGQGDKFLSNRGISCRHHIRAHFGSIQQGELGTRTDKRLDIIGSTVNTMFLLKASEFAITPEAFRKLKPETRKFFKKHTPPVTYIPLSLSHKD
ncbi:MAG: adenylate/guanylate cyclase domain-containing protein [Methylacidiphilales bacterium]|nr:adenylate/guanylate cyclase domain-containing protein [Candidatus Methylacidiphilales bacterium]